MKAKARVRNIATITTLASRHLSMSSIHCAAIATLVLAVMVPSAASLAFSRAHVRNQFGGAVLNGNSNRVGRRGVYDINDIRHHPCSSCLYISVDEDSVNENDDSDSCSESKLHEDDIEEDDEVDIITQKLRRNAVSGPINPMKEHDKMMAENEIEASTNTELEIEGSNNSSDTSLLYSHMLANAIDPDFDPDVSTDEAYVESQFKELLSRKGKELSRLGPGIATLPLDPSSDEYQSEKELAQKEMALLKVIDEAKIAGTEEWDEGDLEKSSLKQSEILSRASKLQSEIDALHVDDCGSVLLANLAFYEAFSMQDAEGMREVWWSSPSVVCMHPSREALVGSNAVVGSFQTLFENGMKGVGARSRGSNNEGTSAATAGVYMTPTNIRGLSVRGSTASLVCDEEVYAKGSAGTSMGRRGGVLLNKLLTTNIFRKIGGKWKMVHRHASWHPETTAAQEAIKAEPGIVLYDEEKDGVVKRKDRGLESNIGMALKKMRGETKGGTSKRPSGSPSVPESLENLDANAVLGVPTPKEEEPKKSMAESDGDAAGMIGKIINLSDLLGGGSDTGAESKEDDEKGLGDSLADLILGAGVDSDSSQTTGSGTPEDPFITRRIIKIGPEGIENLAGKQKKIKASDEANADDGEVVIDLRDKSEEERKEVLSKIIGDVMEDASVVPEATPVVTISREELRQKCIATLRKLSDTGLLSSKQKRVLLTDIITSSARGETSMVEVAYELLCTGEEEKDEAEMDTGMEDFTEQCRVFAAMADED